MPFGQRKRTLEKLRTRGRKNKQAEAKNAPEITNGTMVCFFSLRIIDTHSSLHDSTLCKHLDFSD
jgi:hypothetical protein